MTRRFKDLAPLSLSLFAAAIVVLTALPARADVVSSYQAKGCWSDNNTPSSFSVDQTTGWITANQDTSITCPIVKKTSGSSVTTGDDINLIEMDFVNSNSSAAKTWCDLVIYKSKFADHTPTNIVEDEFGGAEGAALTAAGIVGSTSVNYWNYATGTFLIPVLHCSITAGNVFKGYVVVESGSDRTGRIISAASCSKHSSMTSSYFFNPSGSDSPVLPGLPTLNESSGFIEAVEGAGGNATFAISCPVVASGARTVELAFKPSVNVSANSQVTCALRSFGPSSGSATLSPVPSIAASGTFLCKTPALGDAQFLGFRIGATAAVEKKINAGGSAAAPFATDSGSTGGTTINHMNTISTTGVTAPAPQAVYQTARVGNFSYTLGGFVPNATYKVRLHFAETYWNAAGKRKFQVKLNGTQVLNNFDIYVTAGNAMNKAVVREFTNVAADASGNYKIELVSQTDNSLLSGIEILAVSGL